jgi:hypothetical protein
VRATGAAAVAGGAATGVDAQLSGKLACSEEGIAALAALGLVTSTRRAAGCPVFKSKAAEGVSAKLALDADEPAMAQALSEAALVLRLARALAARRLINKNVATAEGEDGLLLARLVLTGPAAVAKAAGEGSELHAAAATILAAALNAADGVLRPAFPADRFVSVVVSTASVSDHAARAARALQASPAASPTPAASTAVTLQDVAAYQVALWTAVVLGAALLATVYFMLGMDAKKDPQLYAQIADPRGGAAGGAAAAAGRR